MAVVRPTMVEPRQGYGIWMRYEDGSNGEIDLSDLAGRGVFQAWSDRAFFETVHIAPHDAIAWGEDIELCPDALYLQLTGKTAEQIMPGILGPLDDA